MKKYPIIIALLASIFVGDKAIAVETAQPACLELTKTLSIGTTDRVSEGDVRKLQDFLRKEGVLDHVSTGYFGALTFEAVKKFQTAHNIETIGIVGPKTRAQIKTTSCTAPLTASNSTFAPANVLPVSQTPVTPALMVTTTNLPFTSIALPNWTDTWGSVTATPGGLLLEALPETTGAEAIARSGTEWSDYRYNANVTASNGDVTLIARYADENNYLACNFNRNDLAIIERKNGSNRTVAVTAVEGAPRDLYFFKNMTISMRVQGPTVGCTMIGATDNLTYTFTELPRKGGIGIQTWNKFPGVTTLEVRSVNVTEL